MSETSSAKCRLIAVSLVYYGNNTIARPGHAFEVSQQEAAFLLDRGAATPVGKRLPAYFDNNEPVYVLSERDRAELANRVPHPVPIDPTRSPVMASVARR